VFHNSFKISEKFEVEENEENTSFSSTSNLKSKAISVRGLGGLLGCEMLRIPYSLDSRFRDGGMVVSPTHPPHFTPQKHYYFYVSDTRFCYRLSKPQGLLRPESLSKLKNHT
jgi:hypothetical protein